MIPKDFDKDCSVELSPCYKNSVNICPPTGDAVRLSLEILSFLQQQGVVSTFLPSLRQKS